MGARSIAGPSRRRSSAELRSRVAEGDLAISLRELVLPLACLAASGFECPNPTRMAAGVDTDLSPNAVADASRGLYVDRYKPYTITSWQRASELPEFS